MLTIPNPQIRASNNGGFFCIFTFMKIQVSKNYETLKDNYLNNRGIILEGGSRSGKTYSIIQFLTTHLLANTGLTITIGRETLTDIKDTILPDLFQIFGEFGLEKGVHYTWNKSEKHINLNGNLIRYIGVNDNPNKTHGLRQDIFWLNEIMPIDKFTFDQLEQRTTDFWILDYNPSSTIHWAYDVADKREDVLLFKSTVLDNPFVPPEVRKKILGYEPTERNQLLGTADEFLWKVYGQGERADAENKIFRNYELFDIEPIEYDYKFYGLDFGYANDPNGCVQTIINGNNIYITEILYEKGLLNGEIAEVLRPFAKDELVFCDSAEPKSIADLRLNHQIQAVPAKKGAGTIIEGIKRIKSFKIHLNKKSLNLQNEFQNYSYIEKAGKTIPEDKNNHLIDALRYSLAHYR